MTTPATPGRPPARAASHGSRGGQRFGRVTGRRPPAGGPGAHPGSYLVRDEDSGITYTFGYADIVTEGLRTVRTGERVRFLIDPADPSQAIYVIRLDLPDIGEYYQ
jgi:hypothetical protein